MNADVISPEQRLFVGVIVNAAQEAAGNAAAGERAEQQDARAWFAEGGEDFGMVCELAGLEPRDVQARVLAYLERVQANPEARAKVRRATSRPRCRAVSIADVATCASVSPTTVSNVIHGRGTVALATRARVLAAIDGIGYRHHVH